MTKDRKSIKASLGSPISVLHLPLPFLISCPLPSLPIPTRYRQRGFDSPFIPVVPCHGISSFPIGSPPPTIRPHDLATRANGISSPNPRYPDTKAAHYGKLQNQKTAAGEMTDVWLHSCFILPAVPPATRLSPFLRNPRWSQDRQTDWQA